MSPDSEESGFTLVEMLVVLTLVSLLMAISLPYSQNSGDARRLDAVAQIVASRLREARSIALVSNERQDLVFDLREHIIDGHGMYKAYRFPAGVTMTVTTVDEKILDKSAAFTFFPDGGSTGGKVVLDDGKLQRVIAINWLTGSVVLRPAAAP